MSHNSRLTIKNLLGFLTILIFSIITANASVNFDYDRKADFGVFRPSTGNWHSYSTESESFLTTQWGLSTDVIVPADYDGDGLTDIAVWRPKNGVWYVRGSRDQEFFAVQWGTITPVLFGAVSDIPVPADYDGDGHADFAVWRPADGVWYVLESTQGFNSLYAKYFQWGRLGDIPVPADYDGDGKTDFAVFRSSENRWYIFQSATQKWTQTTFGEAGNDLLLPADYTGDGKADIAVYRKGIWYIRRSHDEQIETHFFGLTTDKPVPADFDGDGKTDIAVYRDGTWFIYESSTSNLKVFYYGTATDIPLNSINIRQSIVPIP